MIPPVERSLFGFIIRYSKREQLLIVPLVGASMLIYYSMLDLPKTIINEAIQGKRFPEPDATVAFLKIHFTLPHFLGGETIRLFDGFALHQLPYLFALTFAFLALIVVNGGLKLQINTMKGWLGERMLRRLRYALFDRILRFPLARFRRIKSAELATMIKDEVEPLGGFIGESLITPLSLGRRGAHGDVLHPLPAPLSRPGRARRGGRAGGHHPAELRRQLLVLARQRQLARAPARRPDRRVRRRRDRDPRPRHLELRARRDFVAPRAASSASASSSTSASS